MLTTTAPITHYMTPWDADKVVPALIEFLRGATTSLYFSLYGCTLVPFFDEVIAAHKRNVQIVGCFDHTQASGPTEASHIHRMCLAAPDLMPSLRVGTSPVAHQILHLKGIVVDDERIWCGSWNVSESASRQLNDVNIVSDATLAASYVESITQVWQWISSHETYALDKQAA